MPQVIRISNPSSSSSQIVVTNLGQGVVMSHSPQIPVEVTKNIPSVRLPQPLAGVGFLDAIASLEPTM